METSIGFVLAAALATVLAVAGTTKLLAPSRTGRALRDFGVPARAAPISSRVLPAAELAPAS